MKNKRYSSQSKSFCSFHWVDVNLSNPPGLHLKKLSHGLRILGIFQVGWLWSVSIFSIFDHPVSSMVYHDLFGVFLS